MSWEPLPFEEEERYPEPEKLIIVTAAPGATISKKQNPYLPCTPEEIAKNHIEAVKAGASVVHIHVRDKNCVPCADVSLYRRVIELVKAECPDVIIDICASIPLDRDTLDARLKPLFENGLQVELATMSTATLNVLHERVFFNRETWVKAAVKYLMEKGIKPILTVYNLRSIEDVKKWVIKSGLVGDPPIFNISLGLFGDPARRETLRSFVQNLPSNSKWICESAGRNWLPVAVEAILLGGHVRAGMEDGIYMYPHKDDLIRSSAEAVSKVVKIAKELGRDVATPVEARRMLGLPGR